MAKIRKRLFSVLWSIVIALVSAYLWEKFVKDMVMD